MPAAAQKNYYDILGVSKNASKDEIRKAYLALAKKNHPDKTGGDKEAEERLKEINAAYDVLKNDEKRKQYDAELENPFAGGGGGGSGFSGGFSGGGPQGFGFTFGGGQGGESFGFGGGLDDLFEGLFGGGATAGARTHRPRTAHPGNDLKITLDISLREAATGTKKTVRLNRQSLCPGCKGTGGDGGAQAETCPECQGSGRVQRSQGAVYMAQACPRCRGEGRVVSNPCGTCGGTGHVRQPQTVTVTIPAGADTGTRLRLQGQGDAGEQGAPPGDLYATVRVQPDPVFTREGDNLRCEAPIRFTQAALGGTAHVPTLTGKAALKIPAGTQSGKTFRLRGQGMPSMQSGKKGDLLVTVRVQVPASLTKEQRDLIKKLDETL
ncbi:MAG: molecular chaperone DnaJ [Candidatus Hydrogenedentota bacterium]